jgi:hypothetical protein
MSLTTYKPFYIASFEDESGLFTYLEPFLAPEKAFPVLEDAYAWRARIKKRLGFSTLGRLRRVFTALNYFTSSASPWSFNLKVVTGYVSTANNANPGQVTTTYAHGLSNGDLVIITGVVGAVGYNNVAFTITVVDATNFTVGVDAAAFGAYVSGGQWISNRSLSATEPNSEIKAGSVVFTIAAITFTDQGDGTLTSVTPGNSGTIDYATGAVVLTHTGGVAALTTVVYSYYPSLPVMGLRNRELTTINREQTVAFDTRYAYRYITGQFEQLPSTTGTSWFGSDSNFFWSTNYYQNSNGDLFWATNFNKGNTPDPLRFYDGTDWTTFAPTINGANELHQCLILLPYKDRLLAFNTWEGASLAAATNFPQRLRFSQNGDPTDQTNGWLDNTIGRGGYIDAPTNEQIISAEFIKDILIVKFERSSWKIIYTGNEALPFVFQKINTELGAESTYSLVPFDRGVFAVGNVGITTDDSVNVARIDQAVPQIVFNINNDNDGVKRVYGIRDYSNQLVYWTFPNSAQNPTYPNKVLVYNYVNGTYAVFNDSFTCYGYFQRTTDVTWATLPYENWSEWNNPWDSGIIQSDFPDIVAGNQQGFVLTLNQGSFNGSSLAITAITAANPVQITSPNHNLQTGQFVKVTGIIGSGSPNPNTLNDVIYRVIRSSANVIELQLYNTTSHQCENVELLAGGTYLGGGVLTVLNNINIQTKRFSPFYELGSQVRLGYVDCFLQKTSLGEVSIDCFIDENTSIPINDPSDLNNNGLLGDNVVLTRPETGIPFQAQQEKIWHRIYFSTSCQNFQLKFYMDDAQMSDEDINSSDFVLHALTLYLSQNTRMVQ